MGVQIDSSGQTALQDSDVYSVINEMIQFDTFVEAVMDLTAGRIDAIVVDEINARYVVELNQYAVEVTDVSLGAEQYGIGFRMDDVELRNEIDSILDALVVDGTTATISDDWFGEDIFRK